MPDTVCSVAEIVEKSELIFALHNALNQLTPTQKAICEYVMAGKSERKIAELLSMSQSTVNYQKNKAFSQLREVLKEYM